MDLPLPSPIGATHRADDAHAPTLTADSEVGLSAFARTTGVASVRGAAVLPTLEAGGDAAVRLVAPDRKRYEPLRKLGAGGMGEIALVHDHDIDRAVALKRLLPEASDSASLARFVEEIRTVGRLEHPNVVPIHDVGVDEQGRYFFVMKYLEGETLEDVVAKLAAGDPAYGAIYSFERRTQVFIGLLRALEFAHARGIVHRDVKPANVMIGRYGEVVLMDWGIAKPVGGRELPLPEATRPADADRGLSEARTRVLSTRHGALVGTPAYMSPEQARGDNASVDARSDLYAAAVLFQELLMLRHYLAGETSLPKVLAAIASSKPLDAFRLARVAKHPDHPLPPWELVHFLAKGLQKDPALRFQSASEMIGELERILEGRVRIQCSATLSKRLVRELGRSVDRRPALSLLGLALTAALLAFALVEIARRLLA